MLSAGRHSWWHLVQLYPSRQRLATREPALNRGMVFQLEAALRRALHVRIARNVGDGRVVEREPVVILESPGQHVEPPPPVDAVLLDVAVRLQPLHHAT